MNCSPKIENVSFGRTRRVEALEHVLLQVDGERTGSLVLGSMNRTWATSLIATPHLTEDTEMAQDLFHRYLTPQLGEVDEPTWLLDGFRAHAGGAFVDATFRPAYFGARRGDRFSFRALLVAARDVLLIVRSLRCLASFPGIMVLVKRLATLPDREYEMQKFPHAVAQSNGA